MKEFFRDIRSDKLTFRGFSITFIFILLPLPYILLNYKGLPPFMPIFNQLPWGPPRLSPPWGIFLPSIISFFILIINVIFSSFLYKKTPLISRMLAVTSLLIATLTLLYVIRTIQIVL